VEDWYEKLHLAKAVKVWQCGAMFCAIYKRDKMDRNAT